MRITLPDLEMAVDDEGAGPALLLIHGFPLSRGAWAHQRVGLRPQYRVLCPDLRGFGESPAQATGAVPMTRFADDLKSLLDHLGTGPAVIAGHSMGGYIALAFAKAYPGMVRGVALVATRPGADTPETAAGRRGTAQRVRDQGPGIVIDAMAPKMVADPALVPSVRNLMSGASAEGIIGALLGMADRPDSADLLPTLNHPVWIVSGDTDVLIPHAESERMASLIPGSTLTLIPGAGHLVAYERPGEFTGAMAEWLARIR